MPSYSKILKKKNRQTKWLLVEILKKNGLTLAPIGIPDYVIIEKSSLPESESNKFFGDTIQFYYESNELAGKVRYFSQNRKKLERKMEIDEAKENAKTPTKMMYFLIQVKKGKRDIVHAIVNQNNIIRMPGAHPNERQVLLNTDSKNGRHVAIVLCYNTDREYLEVEFQKLKQWCFDKLQDTTDHYLSIGKKEWILALYTCDDNDIVYTLINNSETLNLRNNDFEDVITYTTNGRDLYQMIVIRKSYNRARLISKMNKLRHECLFLRFPLETKPAGYYAVPPLGFRSYLGTLDKFKEITCHSDVYEKALNRLEYNVLQEQDLLMDILSKWEYIMPQKSGQKNSADDKVYKNLKEDLKEDIKTYIKEDIKEDIKAYIKEDLKEDEYKY